MRMGEGKGRKWGQRDFGVLFYILWNCINFHKHILFLEFEQKVFVNNLRCPEIFTLLLFKIPITTVLTQIKSPCDHNEQNMKTGLCKSSRQRGWRASLKSNTILRDDSSRDKPPYSSSSNKDAKVLLRWHRSRWGNRRSCQQCLPGLREHL